MMMMMILTLHWCVLIDVCICSERDGRVCKDRDDVSRQGTRDVHAVLSLSPQSVWTRWLAGLSVSLSLSVSRCLSVYVFVWLFVCEHKLMLIICSDSVVKVVLLFSSVLCVCLFVNTITLEPFEISSWKFYRSKIWAEARTSSKMAAFCCTVAHGGDDLTSLIASVSVVYHWSAPARVTCRLRTMIQVFGISCQLQCNPRETSWILSDC